MEDKVLALVNGAEIKESDIQNTINRFPSDKKAQLSTENGKKPIIK